MKPEAQPRHRQDSQQHKDALGRTAPKGAVADSASLLDSFTCPPTEADQANTPTMGENAPTAPCGLIA
jgi:hypothetical protein